jgi:hypothetical protein
MWIHRNSILHSTSVPLRDLRESAVDAQIRNLYAQQHDFAVSDHTLFDTSLEARLQCPLRSKKHWIRLAKRYHASTHDRKTGRQPLISSYFTSHTSASVSTSDSAPLTHRAPPQKPKRTRPPKKPPFQRPANQKHRRQIQLALDT